MESHSHGICMDCRRPLALAFLRVQSRPILQLGNMGHRLFVCFACQGRLLLISIVPK